MKPVRLEMVKEIMANADVGITTHIGGNFGNLYFSTKIIEFMSQRLPVISSRTYTIGKYIPDNAIFYFEPEQVEDLVRTIMFMKENPNVVQEKIRNASNLVLKYCWQKEKNAFVSFYQQMLDSGQ